MNPPAVATATPVIPNTVFIKETGSTDEMFVKFILPSTANAVIEEVVVKKNPASATKNPASNPAIGPLAINPDINPANSGPNNGNPLRKNIAATPTIIASTNIKINMHSNYKKVVIL